ncbi:hypothetical protein [Terriglobus sp. ADX1]|uniref:hypothetical protein n=1 Tax=Terriglobus sp. ADX1 TaxID=2794063 RepID=UPI002FE603F5
MLLRIFGEPGDVLRVRLKKLKKRKKSKKLKLITETYIGKAYENPEKDRMFVATNESRTPVIYMALILAQNAGFATVSSEKIHLLRINLRKRYIQVGTAKTRAGMGRIVPLNTETYDALLNYLSWHGSDWRTTAGVVSLPFGSPTPQDHSSCDIVQDSLPKRAQESDGKGPLA